jgi:multidrug transporter EmrE-like cation transporter
MSGVIPTTYWMLLVCILTETMEQISFKLSESAPQKGLFYTGLGIFFYILHMAAWFWVLAILPLGIALPLMGASYITVALASLLLFDEQIHPQRWAGMFLIMLGLCCVWKVAA